jgi:uncharacterized protein
LSWRLAKGFLVGAVVGILGGLIGLGGAEFRLPVLIGVFELGPLAAVILNKAMSLVVVTAAIPARLGAVPSADVLSHWPIILNLLCGSIVGAWAGASWALKVKTRTFYLVIAALLLLMAFALLLGHALGSSGVPAMSGLALIIAGLLAGFGIGVVASLLGVAGGELLIPTLVLLYGVDVKLAGSLSLVVSLPTMIAGFARYSQDKSFKVIREEAKFFISMATGSVLGAYMGGKLLTIVHGNVILPLLAGVLVISTWKMWKHSRKSG